eukprot:XP_011679066.1 PREDICTED: vesicle transport through interaction with t-SNAREs homolog 1B [Strongylocentrotus purpuratus]
MFIIKSTVPFTSFRFPSPYSRGFAHKTFTMSSEQFERIEDDYRTLCDTVKYKLEARIPNSSGEERKKLLREVLRETEDLLVMVTGLENEASPAPGSFRTQLMGKVRSYRREVERLQKDALRRPPSSGGSGGSDWRQSRQAFDVSNILACRALRCDPASRTSGLGAALAR